MTQLNSDGRFDDEEIAAYDKRNQVTSMMRHCISELLERFWILRETDERLFFQIKDNEAELRKYFRETFRFQLHATYDVIKLEKIPVQPRTWMGEQVNAGMLVFKSGKDYGFFFWLLAFLSGKKEDQQFTLQDFCEYLEMQQEEEDKLEWKGGEGFQNRLSLVRIMKYAVKMHLLTVIDREIDDFSNDGEHNVLLQRTPYVPFFTRAFQDDLHEWHSLQDFIAYLAKGNQMDIDRKHRYYRRLFLEPIVEHASLTEEERDYVKNYCTTVDNHLYRYYDYAYERYPSTSFLVKGEKGFGERVYPSDNMIDKLILLVATHLYDHRMAYPLNSQSQIELTEHEFKQALSEIRDVYRTFWTKKLKMMKLDDLFSELITEMKRWCFVEEAETGTWLIQEGLFRMMGSYPSRIKG